MTGRPAAGGRARLPAAGQAGDPRRVLEHPARRDPAEAGHPLAAAARQAREGQLVASIRPCWPKYATRVSVSTASSAIGSSGGPRPTAIAHPAGHRRPSGRRRRRGRLVDRKPAGRRAEPGRAATGSLAEGPADRRYGVAIRSLRRDRCVTGPVAIAALEPLDVVREPAGSPLVVRTISRPASKRPAAWSRSTAASWICRGNPATAAPGCGPTATRRGRGNLGSRSSGVGRG